MKELANRTEVIEEIAQSLMRLDLERRKYQTDLYLYIDKGGIGRIVEYENVGGNSWLDDDHITIYSEMPCYDSIEDVYGCSVKDYIDGRDDGAFYDSAESILERAEEGE